MSWMRTTARVAAIILAAGVSAFVAAPAQASHSGLSGNYYACSYPRTVGVQSTATAGSVYHSVTAGGTAFPRSWNNTGTTTRVYVTPYRNVTRWSINVGGSLSHSDFNGPSCYQ